MNVKHLGIFVFLISVFLLLAGCGGSRRYAVVLWPPEEVSVDPGAVVRVSESARIEKTHTIRLPESGDRVTIPQWRAQVFDDEEGARAFAEEYAAFAETYATARRRALPVRSDRSGSARALYRLRDGERVKVVHRSEEPSDEGGLVDYWYEVLTTDGTRGWVFGHYLSGVSETDDEGQTVDLSTDPLLDRFLSHAWRPTYFGRMIDSGRIDLDRFRSDYGLFPEPENNRIRLNLENQRAVFEYSDWIRGGSREFIARNTPFSVRVRAGGDVSVRYRINGRGYEVAMETLDADIEEIRRKERARREERYASLRSRGSLWRSDSYGSVRLYDDMAFEWDDYSRLVPRIIPQNAGNSGTVDFDYFLTEELSRAYDGVISFRFRGADETPVAFLYEVTTGGIRLSHAPQDNIRDNVVRRDRRSPVVIYFSFAAADTAEGGESAETPEHGGST
ncbi:MAG: SH3 domain-containing protein [Spirochaetaceae bacterium]